MSSIDLETKCECLYLLGGQEEQDVA